MTKIETILFWILILLIIGVAIWKLVGSPTDTAALISVALFVAGSEILIWKTLFSIDKKACVGFEKIKGDINNKLLRIENKLENIDTKFGQFRPKK